MDLFKYAARVMDVLSETASGPEKAYILLHFDRYAAIMVQQFEQHADVQACANFIIKKLSNEFSDKKH